MNESGRGSRRRPFRKKEREREGQPNAREAKKAPDKPRYDKNRGTLVDRPKWIPPRPAQTPLPKPECAYCGKPIQDLAAAITDTASGLPVHFDCAVAKLAETERLGEGDSIGYIGGGRFGVLHFSNPEDPKSFQIKKIIAWEHKENRADWRRDVADRYSAT
jgi:hypothetical protein